MQSGLVSYDFCALDIASITAATDFVAMTLTLLIETIVSFVLRTAVPH
jgi:hypothetical protein